MASKEGTFREGAKDDNWKGNKESNYEKTFMPYVFVYLSCCNKILETEWHFSQFGKLGSTNQGAGRLGIW